MKFTQTTPSENYPLRRFVSETGLWEAGLYGLAYGNIRVRAGSAGNGLLAVDYCGSITGDMAEAERLLVQVLDVLSTYPENTSPLVIDTAVPHAAVKPATRDPSFLARLAAWRAERRARIEGPRSSYTYTVEDNIVCVVDLNRGRSVTNDAECVIADLARHGLDLTSLRVIYRDTEGHWDEIELRDGQFAGFRFLRASDKESAKSLLSTSLTP